MHPTFFDPEAYPEVFQQTYWNRQSPKPKISAEGSQETFRVSNCQQNWLKECVRNVSFSQFEVEITVQVSSTLEANILEKTVAKT